MTDHDLAQANQHLSDGKLEEAEKTYLAILSGEKDCAEALYGLGVIALDRDQTDKAIAHFKRAVGVDPDDIRSLSALGAAFIKAELPEKATTVLAETINRAPSLLTPRLDLARAYSALQRHRQALKILLQTVQDFPAAAEAWSLKGRIERQLEEKAKAYESFKTAAGLSPRDPGALNDFGVACRAMRQFKDAEAHYRAALDLDASFALAHANLGNVLELQGRPREAEKALRRAVELTPDDQDAQYNLASLLCSLERPDEALPIFQSLSDAAPKRWDVLTNLGVTLLALGDLDAAEAKLRASLSIKPDNPEAHYNLGWLLLLRGNLLEGWDEVEWRWQLPDFNLKKRTFSIPTWDGETAPKATLFLHAEQGLGDTIQFCRLAAHAKKRCGKVVMECQPALERLLQDIDGIDELIPTGGRSPVADVHLPLLSLPRVLAFDGSDISGHEGYISAPNIMEDHLRLRESQGKRIGLVWAGSPDNKIDRRRKMTIEHFLPLFDSTDADFVSLQVGPSTPDLIRLPQDRIIFDCSDKVKDFADTAAVISQLDLVIGIDTSVIHLSGAMAVPTWVLLPFMPDYRWGLGRASTPWYDSIRLFRQSKRGDWTSVIDSICKALRSW